MSHQPPLPPERWDYRPEFVSTGDRDMGMLGKPPASQAPSRPLKAILYTLVACLQFGWHLSYEISVVLPTYVMIFQILEHFGSRTFRTKN